jgi:subtilase family serine protease
MVEVAGLEAGQAAEVTLRLPQSALMLVSTSGHTSRFDKLAVMVDVDGRLHESDKTNNAAVLDRSVLETAE